MKSRALFFLVLIVVLSGCGTVGYRPSKPPRYRIIAYVRGRAEIHRISAEKLTHINYAFALVSPQGELVFDDPDAPAHLAQLQALKGRNRALKLLVSVGGWGADNFSDAAASEQSRGKFAASAVEMLKRYGLDGIDLDWEYPGQAGPGIKFRAEDKENFTLMLRTLRAHLDRLSDERKRAGYDRYTLSIASSAGPYFKHTEMDRLHTYLDWINIMTYDFFGSWSQTTGHHSGLRGRQAWNTMSFVRQHLEAGIPPKKLVVGAAFYGRGWAGVVRKNRGIGQPFEKYAGEFPFSRLLREFIGQQGFLRLWDPAARAGFLWNAETGTFISYDDPAALKEKTRFIRRHGLGGIMYWEHSHDPEEQLLDVLVSGLR